MAYKNLKLTNILLILLSEPCAPDYPRVIWRLQNLHRPTLGTVRAPAPSNLHTAAAWARSAYGPGLPSSLFAGALSHNPPAGFPGCAPLNFQDIVTAVNGPGYWHLAQGNCNTYIPPRRAGTSKGDGLLSVLSCYAGPVTRT